MEEKTARSAKETGCFPYNSKLVCYLGVKPDGSVVAVGDSVFDRKNAYYATKKGECKLYAVWPGQYRSDLFIIDNLDEMADALGIPTTKTHVHNVVWTLGRFDDGHSVYASVDVRLPCGCSIDKMGIRKFAADMKEQRGWEVAVSTGYSAHTIGGDTSNWEWTIRVKLCSLR